MQGALNKARQHKKRMKEGEGMQQKFYSFATAASCFSKRMQENEGVWDFKRGFLYQI